jgi:hypothetical protein
MYNLRPRKAINYDENSYFESIGIEELKIKNTKNESYDDDEDCKSQIICNLRNSLNLANMAPIKHRHIFVMQCIDDGMEYIRKIGDSENLKLVVKNKIGEFKDKPKMKRFKNKLNEYYNELG